MPYNYYDNHDYISNSDLNSLRSELSSAHDHLKDLKDPYLFGSLVDAMLTEEKLLDTIEAPEAMWEKAKLMTEAFRRDPFCKMVLNTCKTQYEVYRKKFKIDYRGEEFYLPAKCKFDFYGKVITADLKTTEAGNQKAFEESIDYFNWDQQRAWYMDLSRSDKDILIGISKKWPHKIFKKAIVRGDETYERGKAKYSHMAYMYHTLVMPWQ